MPYDLSCTHCGASTRAWTIVDLIQNFRTGKDRLRCPACNGEAHVLRSSRLQEHGAVWDRWIKGVIPVATESPTFTPYVFLTADSADGEVTSLHFNYFKDTRSEPGGRLKHGHGPGGAPVLTKAQFLTLVGQLVADDIYTRAEIVASLAPDEPPRADV